MRFNHSFKSEVKARLNRRNRLHKASHGALVLETLVSLFVGLLTGAGLLVLVQLTMTQRSTTMGAANSDAEARLELEKVADSLCDAQSYVSGSNKVCFSAAAASDITCYSDTTGDTAAHMARYYGLTGCA